MKQPVQSVVAISKGSTESHITRSESPEPSSPATHTLLGVTFRNLNVYGFNSSQRYQSTAASAISDCFGAIRRTLGQRHRDKTHILHGFDGLVRRGEMLLVLGRPGSGCSTFLKTLSGDDHGLHIHEASKINYGDVSYQDMHSKFKGVCIYLSEHDAHFPELTLEQTIGFVAATRSTSPLNQPKTRHAAREVSSMFGLEAVLNTKIGNSMIRGLSGGEKRRTSIAEAYVSGADFTCWDNSTRGLDSITALSFVRKLRRSTCSTQSTAFLSIYQASDSIYENFDKVILLYEGHQIYFGPASQAVAYFVGLGFVKPDGATIADFLTSLTHPAERRIRSGYESQVPHSAEDFANMWRLSAMSIALLRDIEQFETANGPSGRESKSAVLGRQSQTYSIPVYVQIALCIRRGFQRLRNNYVPPLAAILGNTIIAIVVGSVYYNLGDDTNALEKRAVLVFFSLVINAYAPAFEIMAMWAQRPIVEKQSRYALYRPFTESCASLICDLPNKLATCLMFNTTLYFMANLRRSAAAFFTYLTFVLATILTMSMFFRMVGSLSGTLEQTMVPVSMVILIFSAYAGFIIPVQDMVGWLGWLRRLNPLSFAYESLMINEFSGRRFPCSLLIPAGPSYAGLGLENKVCAAIGSRAGNSDVDGSIFIAEKYGFMQDHLWRNIAIILSMLVIICAIHLIAAEYVPTQRSRGEVLVFKNRPQRNPQAMDEEALQTNKEKDLAVAQLVHSRHSQQRGDTQQSKQNDDAHVGLADGNVQGTFHWSKINYSINSRSSERRILTDVEGWVKPGTLTALMGVTGAGKTSLLDILACRTRTGVITGDIFVDSQKLTTGFQRRTGYVQQEDIHLPTTTVREALEFSASLRQSNDKTAEEKSAYVQQVIEILDMEAYADAVVGVPGEGLNVEQRKRLSTAVEMVAKPEVLLFLDEPTSGLDSQTAWSICMLLRKLAASGQAILVTIHQPSSQLFHIFDRLILLDKTGKTLYFGDIGSQSSTMIEYFERNGATECRPSQNPAEWILDVTQRQNDVDKVQSRRDQDWCEVWARSEERKQVLHHIEDLKQTEMDATSLAIALQKDYRPVPFSKQVYLVTRRVFQEYWRDPVYLYSKAALCAGVTLLNGLSFLNANLNIQGITNIFFSIFLFTQLFSTLDQQIIPRLTAGRALFESRERRSKTYSWTVMIFAHVTVELFWQTVAAVLVFITWWYPTGLWRNGDPTFGSSERSGLAFGMIWLFNLWISTFSQLVGVAIEHVETAVQIATLFFWLSLVFCGVLVPPKDIPQFWKFVYRASPLTYFIDGTVVAGLANTPIHCSPIEFLHINPPPDQSCTTYMNPFISLAGGYLSNPDARTDCLYCPVSDTNTILSLYGVDVGKAWHNFGYLSVYIVFNIAATFGVYWVARERKAAVKAG